MSSLEREVDRAIARENKAFEATLCRKCGGTGRLYSEPAIKGQPWPKRACDRCRGTGERNPR